MTKHSTLSVKEPESIDAIIDAVAADPRQAAHAKSLLREKVMPNAVVRFPTVVASANDDDEMWDNMPV